MKELRGDLHGRERWFGEHQASCRFDTSDIRRAGRHASPEASFRQVAKKGDTLRRELTLLVAGRQPAKLHEVVPTRGDLDRGLEGGDGPAPQMDRTYGEGGP